MQPRHGSAFALYACAVAFTSASAALHAAAWESIPAFSGTIVIESDTLAPSTQAVGTGNVWVRYTPTLAVDCSPPRGCYANSQRIHYSFSCEPRYAVVVERISMDLNGAVLKHEKPGNYAATNDEAAKRILRDFCSAWERG